MDIIEMYKFLEMYNLTKLKKEKKIENMNRTIINKEIESVIKNNCHQKSRNLCIHE